MTSGDDIHLDLFQWKRYVEKNFSYLLYQVNTRSFTVISVYEINEIFLIQKQQHNWCDVPKLKSLKTTLMS